MQTSVIYCGDCQRVLPQAIPDLSVDLIYVDPPFFSNEHYEVLWGDGYEKRAFEDRWKGGIENYVAWMDPKLRECYRVLKSTGSMYVHCDHHASAHLRILLDKIFGEGNFRNEIIWKRSLPHGNIKGKFGASHDTILFYTKSKRSTWNPQFQPHRPEYIEQFYKYKDPSGRKYRLVSCINPNPNRPNLTYEWKGVKRVWKFTKEKMAQMDKDGLLVYSRNGVPQYKNYLDKMKGVPMQDIWDDIPPIMGSSKEKLGYPTQKPEALLERIIKASSDPGDIVLDPMCGCGTSVAVAQKLGRKWVGIDVSPTACKLMFDRMRTISAPGLQIEGLPKTVEELRQLQPFEFQNWVCQKVFARASERKVGDKGIDGWLMDGRPLQVKQSESVGRNVVDNFETAIRRMKKDKGVIVAFSFGKGAYEEVARVKNADGVEIELKTVEDIMREI